MDKWTGPLVDQWVGTSWLAGGGTFPVRGSSSGSVSGRRRHLQGQYLQLYNQGPGSLLSLSNLKRAMVASSKALPGPVGCETGLLLSNDAGDPRSRGKLRDLRKWLSD